MLAAVWVVGLSWFVTVVVALVLAAPQSQTPLAPWVAWLALGLSGVLFFLVIGDQLWARKKKKTPGLTNSVVAGVLATSALIPAPLFIFGFSRNVIGSGAPSARDLGITISDPTAASDRAAVLAYARRLEFDTNHHAGDAQFLELKDTTTSPPTVSRGPFARIWPQTQVHRNNISAIERTGPGRGRIVARIWVDPAPYVFRRDTLTGYRQWNLPPDTSYIWIDSLVWYPGGDSASVRRLVIPVNLSDTVRVTRGVYRRFTGWANYARALWLASRRDACDNTPCPWYGCCVPAGCGPD